MFAIFTQDLEGKTWILPVVNPKITKTSKEMIYLPGGEGCLSVDRDTTGITPRYRKITASAYVLNLHKNVFEYRKLELSDYIAIVFQHEYDHLFGTLYVDKLMTPEDAKKEAINLFGKTREPFWFFIFLPIHTLISHPQH